MYEKTMAVNVRGVYIGTQLAVRQMLTQDPQPLPADLEEDLDALDETEGIDALPRMRAPFAQEEGPPPTVGRLDGDLGGRGSRGVIINIGSIHGLIGGPGEPAYAASKAAGEYAKWRENTFSLLLLRAPHMKHDELTPSLLVALCKKKSRQPHTPGSMRVCPAAHQLQRHLPGLSRHRHDPERASGTGW